MRELAVKDQNKAEKLIEIVENKNEIQDVNFEESQVTDNLIKLEDASIVVEEAPKEQNLSLDLPKKKSSFGKKKKNLSDK